jgi:glyoxylase-like metal-dependent hydrolase (beta-lactamase superfamily II)
MASLRKMVKIHPIQTGRVKVKSAQRRRRPGGLARILFDKTWTEWLPIYAWAIEHPEGIFVIDTGETARTSETSYFPRWHPYYRTSVRMDVAPEHEIGPQLRNLGIQPEDVGTVILTHFHTDHAGGLHHFPESEILVEGKAYRSAMGLLGKLQGFLPHRWPGWFSPTTIEWEDTTIGPFKKSFSVTEAGDIRVVPTPGHTAGHVSVLINSDGVSYFLAGDTSYTQELLLGREPDGVSPKRSVAIETIDSILAYSRTFPTVYLPSHDPGSSVRLQNRTVLTAGSVTSA